jgi:cold shock protein
MATGNISRLVRDRGFGFIKSPESSEDVFFHSSSIDSGVFDDLNEGQTVEFDMESDPKQPNRSRAAHVKVSA